MKRSVPIIILLVFSVCSLQAESAVQWLNKKPVYITSVQQKVKLRFKGPVDSTLSLQVRRGHQSIQTITAADMALKGNEADFSFGPLEKGGAYSLRNEDGSINLDFRVIPGWLSLLPPLAAILLALALRQVLIALLAGVWLGTTLLYGYNPLLGFLYALSKYIGTAPAQSDRAAILIFSLTLGGMVGVISRSGGTQGIVQQLAKRASTARRGQFVTWLMGVLIFFDDYANTLIVGNTMRPLTDKLKISREKLSYLVDSTAAPVANIAIISTWIGYELSLINESFRAIGLDQNAYITFFKTIPYNFYPLFTLLFGLLVALLGRDLFAMYRAERRAAEGRGLLRSDATPLSDVDSSELQPKENIPLRGYNALIPVSLVILSTLGGLWYTGLQASGGTLSELGLIHYVSTVIGNSDSFAVLMWAAFIGSAAAVIMALGQRLLTLHEALTAWVSGVKAMVMAAIILTLAWAIGNICNDIQTADYVVGVTRDLLSPHLLPVLTFLIAGAVSFSTGTSWGTMAILTPIVVPLAHQIPALDPALSEGLRHTIFLSSIAAILAGATFGDHCSPISDTTIMSSMASGADHIDHVRTQLPYALIAAGVGMAIGYIPVGYGLPNWLALGLGGLGIFFIVRFAGKRV